MNLFTAYHTIIPPWHLYLDGRCVASWLSLDDALEAAWPLIAECRNVALVRKLKIAKRKPDAKEGT